MNNSQSTTRTDESVSGSSEETIFDPLQEDKGSEKNNARRIDSIMRIPVVVQVVVGSATLPVASLLKLGRGAVIPLDHRVGDPVDIVVNGRTIARGEVVVVEEDGARFGVSLTEICEPQGDRPN